MLNESRIETVVLTVDYSTRSSYYLDWLDAFRQSPYFSVTAFNLFRRGERRAAMRSVGSAEFVVALHACTADTLRFISPLRSALADRRGRLLVLVGNEYNLPWARLADKRAFIAAVNADLVGTQLPLDCGRWLYDGTGARVVAMPQALNPDVFRRERADAARQIDIGGRSAQYSVYVGDDERNRIYEVFAQIGPRAGLEVDIGTDRRLDRRGWAAFLNDCRATVATEAGSWHLERDDATVLALREIIRNRVGAETFRADGIAHSVGRHLPFPVKEMLKTVLKRLPLRHEAIDGAAVFDEAAAPFFASRQRCPFYSKCISSRHFDAAGTGTCQILVRGRYNDILQPGEHYIPVEADLGDIETALSRFRDPAERARIAGNAYDLAQGAHTHAHRLAALHRDLTSSP